MKISFIRRNDLLLHSELNKLILLYNGKKRKKRAYTSRS
jgi:hypothetical protein